MGLNAVFFRLIFCNEFFEVQTMSIGKNSRGSIFEAINTPEFLSRLKSHGSEKNRAFRELVHMTQKPLTYYIRRYIASPEEAQEVLQEVYLGIHKSLSKFEGKSKFSTWVYSLTHYKVCDKISDKSWQHQEYQDYNEKKLEEIKGETHLSKSSAWETDSHKLLMLKNVQQKIPLAVENLSASLKEVYLLRDVEAISSQDTAQILNISEESVRVRLHRARNSIVEMLKKDLMGSSPTFKEPELKK